MAGVVGKTTGMTAAELRELVSDYEGFVANAEKFANRAKSRGDADEAREAEDHAARVKRSLDAYRRELKEVERGEGEEPYAGDGDDSPPTNPADQMGDSIAAVEEATVDAAEAAVEAGRPDLADQVAARVVEELRRAEAAVEDAAEAVEEVAEEVAESTPPDSAAADSAEEAVESANEAQEAVEDAEAALREEVREQGGEEFTREQAAEQQEAELVEEVAESAEPIVAEAIEETSQPVPSEPIADTPPATIRPETDHPWFRRRRIFGKEI